MSGLIVTNKFCNDISLPNRYLVFKCELGGRLVDYSLDSIHNDNDLLREYDSDANQTFPIMYTYYPNIRSTDRYRDVIPTEYFDGKFIIKLPVPAIKSLDAYKTGYLSYMDIDTNTWNLAIAFKLSDIPIYEGSDSIIELDIGDILSEIDVHCEFITSNALQFLREHHHQTDKYTKYQIRHSNELSRFSVANIPELADIARKGYTGTDVQLGTSNLLSELIEYKVDNAKIVTKSGANVISDSPYTIPVYGTEVGDTNVNLLLQRGNTDIEYKNLYSDMPILYKVPSNPTSKKFDIYGDNWDGKVTDTPKIAADSLSGIPSSKFVWGSINRPESYDRYIRPNTDDLENLIKSNKDFSTLLVKTGNYQYKRTSEEFDLNNIRYIKGEWPCYLYMPTTTFTNYKDVVFDKVKLEASNLRVDDYKVTLLYVSEGTTEDNPLNIELKDNCVVEVDIKGNTYINFTNVTVGMTYVLWLKFKNYTYDVYINNTLANFTGNKSESDPVTSGIENSITQIVFTGTDNNGILEEVIQDGLMVTNVADILYEIKYPKPNDFVWTVSGNTTAGIGEKVSVQLAYAGCDIQNVYYINSNNETVPLSITKNNGICSFTITMPQSDISIGYTLNADNVIITIPGNDEVINSLAFIKSISDSAGTTYVTSGTAAGASHINAGTIEVPTLIKTPSNTYERNTLTFTCFSKGCSLQYLSLGGQQKKFSEINTVTIPVPTTDSSVLISIVETTYYSISKSILLDRFAGNWDGVSSNSDYEITIANIKQGNVPESIPVHATQFVSLNHEFAYRENVQITVTNSSDILWGDNIFVHDTSHNVEIPLDDVDAKLRTDKDYISSATNDEVAIAGNIVSHINNENTRWLKAYGDLARDIKDTHIAMFTAPDSNVQVTVADTRYKCRGYLDGTGRAHTLTGNQAEYIPVLTGYLDFVKGSSRAKYAGIPVYKYDAASEYNANVLFSPEMYTVDKKPLEVLLIPSSSEYSNDITVTTLQSILFPKWGDIEIKIASRGAHFYVPTTFTADKKEVVDPHRIHDGVEAMVTELGSGQSLTADISGELKPDNEYESTIIFPLSTYNTREDVDIKEQPIGFKVLSRISCDQAFGQIKLNGEWKYILVFRPQTEVKLVYWNQQYGTNRTDGVEDIKQVDSKDHCLFFPNPAVTRHTSFQVANVYQHTCFDTSVSHMNICGVFYNKGNNTPTIWRSENYVDWITLEDGAVVKPSVAESDLVNSIPDSVSGKGIYINNGDNAVEKYYPVYYNTDNDSGRCESNGTSGVVFAIAKSISATKFVNNPDAAQKYVIYYMGSLPTIRRVTRTLRRVL